MLFSILIIPALISLVLTLDIPQQLISDTDSNVDHKLVSNVVMRWSVARNPTKEEFSKIIDHLKVTLNKNNFKQEYLIFLINSYKIILTKCLTKVKNK